MDTTEENAPIAAAVSEEAKEIEFADDDDDDEQGATAQDAAAVAQPTQKKQKVTHSSPVVAPAAAAAAASSSSAKQPTPSSSAVLSFPDSVLTQPIGSYSSAFDTIARDFLTNYELSSNGERLRLMEIEFYWRGDEHPDGRPSHHDIFAHGHPIQKDNFGKWYWHRQGQKPDAAFKGASYKGADVTFGPVSGGGYGGILLRSVQRVSDGEIIEGSCNVAHEILRHHRLDSIVDLHALWKGDTDAFTNPTLFFTRALTPRPFLTGQPMMIKSPRVGLTLKQAGDTRPMYIMQPYRYTMLPLFNKKQKQTIVLSAYEEISASGAPNAKAELGKLLDMKPAALDKLIAPYEAGKKVASMQAWVKNNKKSVNAEDMCKMFGAWMACHGANPYVAILRA